MLQHVHRRCARDTHGRLKADGCLYHSQATHVADRQARPVVGCVGAADGDQQRPHAKDQRLAPLACQRPQPTVQAAGELGRLLWGRVVTCWPVQAEAVIIC